MGYRYGSYTDFSELMGKTFVSVNKIDGFDGNDAIQFVTEDGKEYQLTHSQDCCEHVYIESVVGDLSDLEGAEILMADESSNSESGDDYDYDSHTWTFYKLATRKGYVDIRFHGSSNGYYSESANLYFMGDY